MGLLAGREGQFRGRSRAGGEDARGPPDHRADGPGEPAVPRPGRELRGGPRHPAVHRRRAGLPTVLNTHDIARHVEPDARVVYVDNDPIVISHARSLLAKNLGVIAVPGDMRDPRRILADPGL